MFYLEPFCYTCFGLNDLERLNKKISSHAYLFNKISIHLPEVNRKPGVLIMCKICCDKIRKNRKFTKKNLLNMKLLNDYISKLKENCIHSTYTLLTIELIDLYPKSMHDWKMGNNTTNEIEFKIYQDCNNLSLIESNDDEKNYLDLSKEKIKQILNDLNKNDGYQNNSSLSNITNSNSSLDVLYSNYNNSDKTDCKHFDANTTAATTTTTTTTTDGVYLENIHKLNETNFDNTDIETIIHSGYSYEIDLTTSSCDLNNSDYTDTLNNCEDDLLVTTNDTIIPMDDKLDDIPLQQTQIQLPEIKNESLVIDENGIEEKSNGIQQQIQQNGNGETIENTPEMIIDVKPFECETCKKRFESDVYLKLHKTKVHSNTANKISKEDLKCSICDKVFKIHSQLVKHVLTHSNDRPFLCIICKKGFKTERNRKAHMLYHTELKFACSICNKKFVTNGILKDHLLTHSDPKFKCSICNRAFTVENYLKKHLKTHDENEKKFQCETCSKRFLYKSNYVAHSLTCTVPNVNYMT